MEKDTRTSPSPAEQADSPLPASSDLRADAEKVGTALAERLGALLGSLSKPTSGPQALSDRLGITVVTASRLLRAIDEADPLAVIQKVPGAVPLRRVVEAARKEGAPVRRAQAAERAIDEFEDLIRRHAGHRSAFSAMLSDWLPQGRREFEIRRRQAAYKAISELRGVSCDLDLCTIEVCPSDKKGYLDLLSLQGCFGIDRIRPDSVVQFATIPRVDRAADAKGKKVRHPVNLDGDLTVDGFHTARLDEFCSKTPAPLESRIFGELVQYTLGDTGFGPESSVDFVIAEVNRAELNMVDLATAPLPPYFFQIPAVPTKAMLFDLLVHRDVFEGGEPQLLVYDTSVHGPARPGLPEREVDLMRVTDEIEPLGYRPSRLRFSAYPRYQELLAHAFGKLDWDPEEFRAYRLHMQYPLSGTQMSMAFFPGSEEDSAS